MTETAAVRTSAQTASDREILAPLADRLMKLASRPGEIFKKELWARHNALQSVERIPVCVTYEGIPDPAWDDVFHPGWIRATGDIARRIERDLRKRIWMAENVPDDHIVWPALFLPAIAAAHDWGVNLLWENPDDPQGARHIVPPLADRIDITRLRLPRTDVDETATAARLAEGTELTGGRLAVHPVYPGIGESPFELAVEMRGMENLFFDVCDRPEDVHALMNFITEATIRDHRHREQCGWINRALDPTGKFQMLPRWRHLCARAPAGMPGRPPRISDEWPYVSAQSACGLGVAMYGEFVHAYNAPIAALFTGGNVYYHGCENLDAKLPVISRLPNLRRHHVSPWSSVALAAKHFLGRVVLEVHAHPTRVIFQSSPEDMRKEIQGLIAAADGHPMSLNLSDIHSLNGKPETLITWARIAREEVEKREA
ncbi:MAG: hypothetical protein V1809_05155 [Planctomycetota bacterium]